MLDLDFIYYTILKAAKGRKNRYDIKPVLDNIFHYVDNIFDLLDQNTYIPSTPKQKIIYDSSSQKERIINILPFYPDCIIQWLIVETIKPILMRGMSHWSCASIPGRGTKRVHDRLEYALRNDVKNTKYALEIDIEKYYPSIKIPILMQLLERKIKDKRLLNLIESIAKTNNGEGLAIGYYLNQWLANYYLETLDTYIYTLDGVKYVTRHMDNIVILGSNKRKLHKVRKSIDEFLRERLQLTMKHNWQVFPTAKRMVRAVGYKYSKTHTLLRKRNLIRLLRQCRKVIKRLSKYAKIAFKQAAGLLSRIGQLKHFDSLNLRQKYIDTIKVKRLKDIVREE